MTIWDYYTMTYDNVRKLQHVWIWQFAFMTICICDTMQKWIYMTMCGYDNLYDNMQIWHCTVMTKFGRNNIRACQNAECRYNNMWIWQYVNMTICEYDNMWIWQYVNMTICEYDNMWIWQYAVVAITRYDTMRKCWHTLFSMMERILYLGWFEQWEPIQRPGC